MPKYKIFSAIELGSAAIIMKIAQMTKKDGVKVIDSVKYDITLGSEVYRGGRISSKTAEEICLCLERCKKLMEDYGAEDYACYATTAVREASNKDYLLDQIKIKCGLKVRIITAAEESFLHNKAFALSCDAFDDMIAMGTVIVDVNSGNTQVSYYDCGRLMFSQEMPIGALRALELMDKVHDAPIGFAGLLEDYISAKVNNDKQTFFMAQSYSYIALTGALGGTIRRIIGTEDGFVSKEQMDYAYSKLRESSVREISEEYGVSDYEAELLFPTVLIYKMFTANNRNKRVLIREVATAGGMCVEYAEKNGYTHTKHRFTNDIISAAQSYAAKFNVNERIWRETNEYAEIIFNSIAKKVGLTKQHLLLLKLSALFADTGKYINLNGYSKHSCGIVKANPIPGLREKQQNAVAYAVGMLEGPIENDDEYRYLPSEEKVLASKLSAILQIARSLVVTDKEKINSLRAVCRDERLTIIADAKSDITIERFSFERVCPFFKEVFGFEAELSVKKARN